MESVTVYSSWLCSRVESLSPTFHYISRNRTELSFSLSCNLDHSDQSQTSLFSFFRHVCYYFGSWHTQVIPWEVWWMSLFGENSRLIGSIYSWVDVPGAEHNLIRQAAAAGLCGEKKAVPSSILNWPEAKILLWRLLDIWKPCQPGIASLTALCVCVHVHVCTDVNVRTQNGPCYYFWDSKWMTQVQSRVVSTVISFAISSSCKKTFANPF